MPRPPGEAGPSALVAGGVEARTDGQSPLSVRVALAGPATVLPLLRQMLAIRGFEAKVAELVKAGEISGPVHFSDGQEAVAAGVCSVLGESDPMLCTYRGHAALLAKGSDPFGLFAEILGRETGVCGGKGGSMHLTDFSVGALGSFPIVGAHLPIALGSGLTAKLRQSGSVTTCFFGDGATNIGAFHEAMNLASVWQLPILWVCENNLYGEYTPLSETTAGTSLSARASSYGVPAITVDGNDALAVREGAIRALSYIREGRGPVFMEALTYRQRDHAVRPDARPRPTEELAHWLLKDPIRLLEEALVESGLEEAAEVSRIRNEVTTELEVACARALSAPLPTTSQLATEVYA